MHVTTASQGVPGVFSLVLVTFLLGAKGDDTPEVPIAMRSPRPPTEHVGLVEIKLQRVTHFS